MKKEGLIFIILTGINKSLTHKNKMQINRRLSLSNYFREVM